jgi:MoaA/NifB/PqqE/SkfB family radical SAM enzyme
MSNIRTATLELTRNCNFRCSHCYVETVPRGGDLLKRSEWIRIIDRLTEIGCRRFILTGGEVLMSTVFPDVYRYLGEIGCAVDIFTNGSILKESHKHLFKAYPPKSVSITLYGNNRAEYHEVTGCDGAICTVIERNITIFRSMGIPVNLGTIVCKGLEDSSVLKGKMSTETVEFNTYLIPALHGRENLKQRLHPNKILEIEILVTRRDENNRRFYSVHEPLESNSEEYLKKCPGGYSSLFVAVTGFVSTCAIYRTVSFDLLDEEVPMSKVLEALADVHEGFRQLYFNSKCGSCNSNRNCRNCPAYSLLETGSFDENPYLCELGRIRSNHYSSS